MSQASLQRAQIYCFLSHAFLYPQEDWREDWLEVTRILAALGMGNACELSPESGGGDLLSLQAEHRRAFGLTGSLFYETEFGLPHEFRQSQEMADIAGFYQAFGFKVGGVLRERPDHLAVELEFMYILALKEAYAASLGQEELVEICLEAQRKFIQDHLGRWIGLFSIALARSIAERGGINVSEGAYPKLARLAAGFVSSDAERLGVQIESTGSLDLKLTPFNPDLSCEGCAVVEKTGVGREV